MAASKKSRTRRILIFIFFGFLLLAGIIGLYYQSRFHWCTRKIRYEAFGISLPSGYGIHGIDVSRYQRHIDWEAVADMRAQSVQMEFAFMKATEGISYVDPHFRRNWRNIRRTHLARGAYHYFRPRLDGTQQAEHFIRQVELNKGDLPPVLDVEEMDGVRPERLVQGVRQWIERIEKHFKVKPIIYTGADFYNRYLFGHFSNYPLWVAHYYQPCEPRVLSRWQFWQHHDRGRVNGIATAVDFNVFHGSRTAFDSLRIPATIH